MKAATGAFLRSVPWATSRAMRSRVARSSGVITGPTSAEPARDAPKCSHQSPSGCGAASVMAGSAHLDDVVAPGAQLADDGGAWHLSADQQATARLCVGQEQALALVGLRAPRPAHVRADPGEVP